MRVLLGAAGVALAGYGTLLLLTRQSGSQLLQVLEWAAAGVVLHDAVLAPLALGLGWVAERRLPPRVAAAGSVVLLVGGTLTIVAVPVLARGEVANANGTLLDRNYPLGWLILLGLTVVLVGLGSATARWREGTHGKGHARR